METRLQGANRNPLFTSAATRLIEFTTNSQICCFAWLHLLFEGGLLNYFRVCSVVKILARAIQYKMDKTLEEVKKEIRSLLISSPVGLRLQDLLSDYRAMIGRHLPFKELGYSSALEMIKHMPDVVYPVFRPGGTMFLEGLHSFSIQRHVPLCKCVF